MWQQIIGAGLGALGSLFGDDDEQTTTTTVDYKAMAKSAEKAGFNPLTALRNGGSAGFTTTTAPALSMADRFGSMFQQLGNAIMAFDPRADERAALEAGLMRAQIGALNRSNAMNGAGAMAFPSGVPSAAGAAHVTGAGRPVNPVIGETGGSPYGPAVPLYKRVFWIGNDGKRYEQDIVNIDVAPDEVTGLGIPAAVRIGSQFDETRIGTGQNAGPLGPRPNRNVRGPATGTPMQLPPLSVPGGVLDDVTEWFKPWKGVFW